MFSGPHYHAQPMTNSSMTKCITFVPLHCRLRPGHSGCAWHGCGSVHFKTGHFENDGTGALRSAVRLVLTTSQDFCLYSVGMWYVVDAPEKHLPRLMMSKTIVPEWVCIPRVSRRPLGLASHVPSACLPSSACFVQRHFPDGFPGFASIPVDLHCAVPGPSGLGSTIAMSETETLFYIGVARTRSRNILGGL